jgi:hypothetical protein
MRLDLYRCEGRICSTQECSHCRVPRPFFVLEWHANMLRPDISVSVTGEIFHTAGYGLAFGRDSTAFVPWSRIISELKEEHVIADMMDSSNERDFGIGESGIQKFRTRCGESSVSDKFILNDFIGLYIILASFLWAGFIAHFTEVRFFHKPIDPFDNDLGQSFKIREDEENSNKKKRAKCVEDIEEKLDEMREKQEQSKATLERILAAVRNYNVEEVSPSNVGMGVFGMGSKLKMIESAPPGEANMIGSGPAEIETPREVCSEDEGPTKTQVVATAGSFKADPDEVE